MDKSYFGIAFLLTTAGFLLGRFYSPLSPLPQAQLWLSFGVGNIALIAGAGWLYYICRKKEKQ